MTGPLEHIEQATDLFFFLLALCGLLSMLFYALRRLLQRWNRSTWPAIIGALLADAGAALSLLALILVVLVKLGLGFEPLLDGIATLLGELALLGLIVLILRREYRRLL